MNMLICRRYREQRQLRETTERVVRLQALVRRWRAVRQLQRLKTQHRAARCIQTHYR